MKLRVSWGRRRLQLSRGMAWPTLLLAMQAAYDAWYFSLGRRHYYAYLAALLEGTRGSRTLKQIFVADAARYGGQSIRGRLSRRWVMLIQVAGGDLYGTWYGVFPLHELAVLRAAQARGGDVLVGTLAELSRVLGVLESARKILSSTLSVGCLAMAVLASMLLAVPLYTAPRLRDTFAALPPEYHGRAARGLFELADWLGPVWPFVAVSAVVVPVLVIASMGRYCGRLRQPLDQIGPWRLYRQVQALRFTCLLAVALGRNEHGTTRLRAALALQLKGATPWMSRHVSAMIGHIDAGRHGAAVFDTGLLNRNQLWFLDDMVQARGLVDGLRQCACWIETHVLGSVARQAMALRWLLLVCAVAGAMMIALWHYAAIDDLRRGLALFHASL